MTGAQEIAKALNGRWHGNYGSAKCPCHDDHTPSLSIRDGESAVLFNCHAGCNSADIVAALKSSGVLSAESPSSDFRGRGRSKPPPEPEPDPRALDLWHGSVPIGGTLAEVYLRQHRGISIELPCSLRFNPSVRYPRLNQNWPALIAGLARPDRKLIAVQTTFLRPDGQKCPLASPRLTFGSMGTGAVRLAPAGEVLGIAEGVETALSAMELSGAPCWASLGGKRLGRVGLPASVREVHLFADSDDAGKLMAERAAGIFTRAGRRVVLRWPPDNFEDWNAYHRAREVVA